MNNPVIYELVGPNAGHSVRLSGFDFHNGEIHVPAANVKELNDRLVACGAQRQDKRPIAPPLPPSSDEDEDDA